MRMIRCDGRGACLQPTTGPAQQESGVLCVLGKGWDTRRSVSRFVPVLRKSAKDGHPADLKSREGYSSLRFAIQSVAPETLAASEMSSDIQPCRFFPKFLNRLADR